ncbi:phosphatase PAP2 family protein [Flavobacterium sp. GB2R13]|uniref:phosphatase PAP2 family protein n=1 Tax=Flavobacterium algoris TaxID=3398733 RepID=UPI003A8735AF
MKTKLTIILFLLLIFKGNAQSNDTISSIKNEDKISYKNFIAPVALITGGALLLRTQTNENLQSDIRNLFGNDFHTKVDNYIQYAPILQIYGGKYLGFKPKNDFLHQTINIIIANAIMGGVVETMKHSFKEERPDHSDNLGFPSGHTATAFTNAALLYYEYKDSNLWYASSGFLFATATGVLRIANNKHYTSDILTGAGIGMAAGLLVSYWHPFQSLSVGKNKKTTAFIYPQLGNQIGMGILVRSN